MRRKKIDVEELKETIHEADHAKLRRPASLPDVDTVKTPDLRKSGKNLVVPDTGVIMTHANTTTKAVVTSEGGVRPVVVTPNKKVIKKMELPDFSKTASAEYNLDDIRARLPKFDGDYEVNTSLALASRVAVKNRVASPANPYVTPETMVSKDSVVVTGTDRDYVMNKSVRSETVLISDTDRVYVATPNGAAVRISEEYGRIKESAVASLVDPDSGAVKTTLGEKPKIVNADPRVISPSELKRRRVEAAERKMRELEMKEAGLPVVEEAVVDGVVLESPVISSTDGDLTPEEVAAKEALAKLFEARNLAILEDKRGIPVSYDLADDSEEAKEIADMLEVGDGALDEPEDFEDDKV